MIHPKYIPPHTLVGTHTHMHSHTQEHPTMNSQLLYLVLMGLPDFPKLQLKLPATSITQEAVSQF